MGGVSREARILQRETRIERNPDESEERAAQHRSYRVKLAPKEVIFGLVRLISVAIIATIVIVFLTSLVVVGFQVGLVGFIDFSVGLLIGQYGSLSAEQVVALRGSLEFILFVEFLFLLMLGLYLLSIGITYPDESARSRLRMRRDLRGQAVPAATIERVGASKVSPAQQDARWRQRRSSLGAGAVMTVVAVFMALALLFQLV